MTSGSIDAASFTAVRIVAGAITLWAIVAVRSDARALGGSWPAAVALFVYAALFSFAYLELTAATGALLLFGAVQATMLGHALWSGERLRARQWTGFGLAIAGLMALLLPGLAAPPPGSAAMMMAAGAAFAFYSILGRGLGDPTSATAGNFLRAVPFAAALLFATPRFTLGAAGVGLAVASGALTSGVGYVLWYAALRRLSSTQAATIAAFRADAGHLRRGPAARGATDAAARPERGHDPRRDRTRRRRTGAKTPSPARIAGLLASITFAARLGRCGATLRAPEQQEQRAPILAAKDSQNVQEVFLNHVRKGKTPVTVFLVNGVKLQGIITWFDNFSVLLRRDGHTQLVYKHAISTVMPGAPISLFDPTKAEGAAPAQGASPSTLTLARAEPPPADDV